MWKSYFRKGDINGIDIHDKSALQEKRIKIFQGDQSDKVFLNKLGNETGPFDIIIIIDDGSHLNEHIIISFNTLFPYLTKPNTAMNFFKSLTDGINHTEYQVDNYQPNYLDKHITSLHFYHNLVFIFKGNSISKIKL